MKKWALACCLLLNACDCNGSAVPELPEGAVDPNQKGESALEESTLQPRTAYKKALEQARKDITARNATSRLESLDEQIEREKEMMR